MFGGLRFLFCSDDRAGISKELPMSAKASPSGVDQDTPTGGYGWGG
jgi:hypothetical protein